MINCVTTLPKWLWNHEPPVSCDCAVNFDNTMLQKPKQWNSCETHPLWITWNFAAPHTLKLKKNSLVLDLTYGKTQRFPKDRKTFRIFGLNFQKRKRKGIFQGALNVSLNWISYKLTFRPCQGTHQRPFCLANSLGITPKVPFANKMMTAVWPSSHKDSRQHKFTSES